MAWQTEHIASAASPPSASSGNAAALAAASAANAVVAAAAAASTSVGARGAEIYVGAFGLPYQTLAPPTIPPPQPILWYPSLCFQKHYATMRGKYRIFNDAEYRFYRSDTAPPEEGSEPFATSSSLPYTPDDVYANGTWYLSMSYFNGVIDSGFLPLGPNGETCLRLDITAGEEVLSDPNKPLDWHLETRAGGVVRIVGVYYQSGDLRADEWAIKWTTGLGTPLPDNPNVTVAMPSRGVAILEYDLPAQEHGTRVSALVQTRRDDGTWAYSNYVSYKSAYADSEGPTTPLSAERWPGPIPEDV